MNRGSEQSREENVADAVSTSALVKRYERVVALDAVDFRVPEGAVYVLVGPNGAGKTSLLRIVMHLVRPDSGMAQVLGRDTRSDAEAIRARIGYVPETHDPGYPWLSAGRLLQYYQSFYPNWDHDYARRLVATFQIPVDQKCGSLSKGEVRRLQIAAALAHRPPLLLLDEPTDGLDHLGRDRSLSVLAEHLSDSPATVVISTHRIHEFEQLIDHIGILRDGKFIAQTTREDLQRTVLRYRADTPEKWAPARVIGEVLQRRPSLGRSIEWIVRGDEQQVRKSLAESGALTRDVAPLSLDEIAIVLLGGAEGQ